MNYVEDHALFTPDQLVLSEPSVIEAVITGAAALIRSAVLGKVLVGAVSAPVAGSNTGDGIFAATPTVGAGAKAGTYTLRIFEAVADGGRFELRDPDGHNVGVGNVGVAFTGVLNFTLQDGSADFIVGDSFTIAVAAGTGNYLRSVAAATDGSQTPCAILAEDVDAADDDKRGAVYLGGEFNEAELNFGAGHTADTVREALRQVGIILSKPVG